MVASFRTACEQIISDAKARDHWRGLADRVPVIAPIVNPLARARERAIEKTTSWLTDQVEQPTTPLHLRDPDVPTDWPIPPHTGGCHYHLEDRPPFERIRDLGRWQDHLALSSFRIERNSTAALDVGGDRVRISDFWIDNELEYAAYACPGSHRTYRDGYMIGGSKESTARLYRQNYLLIERVRFHGPRTIRADNQLKHTLRLYGASFALLIDCEFVGGRVDINGPDGSGAVFPGADVLCLRCRFHHDRTGWPLNFWATSGTIATIDCDFTSPADRPIIVQRAGSYPCTATHLDYGSRFNGQPYKAAA